MLLAMSAENFKAFPQLTHSHTPLHQLHFFSFHPISLSLVYSLCHLYSRLPNGEYHNEMLHRPCGSCFIPADTDEAITARRGQIGWGSYLDRIMFDILHHYQLPPSPPEESYLSLADVLLNVMNFLCSPRSLLRLPTSGPPYLSTSQGLQWRKKKGGAGGARK